MCRQKISRWSQRSLEPSNRSIWGGRKHGGSWHVSTFAVNEELLTFARMEESLVLGEEGGLTYGIVLLW